MSCTRVWGSISLELPSDKGRSFSGFSERRICKLVQEEFPTEYLVSVLTGCIDLYIHGCTLTFMMI